MADLNMETDSQGSEWPFDWSELSITTYREKGKGGFSSTPDRGVQIKHLPSGLEASAEDDRSPHRNKMTAMRELAVLVREWKAAGSPMPIKDDPFPDRTDTELGFAYRMMVKAQQGGLIVDFMTGDISLPKSRLE